MANMSDKNFPHAYGSGRCVASFTLSHPGGPTVQGADATDPGMLQPPAFNMDPADVPAYPDRATTYEPNDPPDGFGTFRAAYSPDTQPFNATSFGVFCTGTGTKSLPYRKALAPFVPASISPVLNGLLPGSSPTDNEIRPFPIVEEARLGTTRAQYVGQAQTSGAATTPGAACWYEVGLNWKVPPLKLGVNVPGDSFSANWRASQIANVRNAMMQSLWINASLSYNATAEPHPDAPIFDSVDGSACLQLTPPGVTNPGPGTGWEAPYGDAFTYGQDPGELGTFPDVISPTTPSLDAIVAGSVYAARADLVLKVTGVEQIQTNTEPDGTFGPDTVSTTVLKLAPVIRVWVLQQTATSDWVPVPLGRAFTRPCSGDAALQPPAVNVSVWQKNSSAADGSVTPVYDLGPFTWSELGSGE